MVAAVGLLLLASLVASSAMSAGVALAQTKLPLSDLTLRSLDWSLSLVAITVLFAATFKLLPDVIMRWRDVWVGAAVTSVLFSIGKFVIGWYLARLIIASAYGAAGSFVLVLVWTYYSAQIFLFGAEVTQAYVRQIGATVRPTRRSQFITLPASEQRRPQETMKPSATAGLLRTPRLLAFDLQLATAHFRFLDILIAWAPSRLRPRSTRC